MKPLATGCRVLLLLGLSAVVVFSLLTAAPARVQGMPLLTRHMHKAVINGQAQWLGPLATTKVLRLTITLPLRNQWELNVLLQQLYDPLSPLYHQFLSPQEFTERFGPSPENYNAVISFAKANGLTVTGTSPNRMIVDVEGPVANIEKACNVTMSVYRHPTEDRTFYSPDEEPTVDLPFPLWHITGLSNFSIPRPASLMRAPQRGKGKPPSAPTPTGSGPYGYFLGSDMRAAYYGTGTLDGAGQSVGLVEFAGYNLKDVDTYFTKDPYSTSTGLVYSEKQVVGVSVDGSSLDCTGSCDDTEQVLDIEQALSMAPGISVYVYVSDTSDADILDAMAYPPQGVPLSMSLSCSWGWSPADPTSDDVFFLEMAVQGQSMFVASGDNGAYGRRSKYVYPADDVWVTSVGGTDLTTTGPAGAWQSETAWSYSGGGVSPDKISIPFYQQYANVITSANKGSTVYRNSPDVAAEANTDNYICYNGNCGGGWGGTSFAAPRWAAYVALANQQCLSHNHPALGFINPAIYTIGLEELSGNSYDFLHDITRGSNGQYSAVPGYDLVTGWGSPNASPANDGTTLIDTLEQLPRYYPPTN